jgi:hypothetical protein
VAKVLLIPFAVFAFVVFLLAIGAFGLLVSMAVISLCGQVWRGISGGGRLIGRGGRRLGRGRSKKRGGEV